MGSLPGNHAEEPDMATESEGTRRSMEDEGEGLVLGPGVLATRSQARGTGAGFLLGLFAGALFGLVAGIVIFQGRTGAIVITIVAFAVAGVVAGHLVGAIVQSKQVAETESADVRGADEQPVQKPDS